jgi:tRNA/tmRNA/rRNA uracil-C5-methylase (TrmA/RlmC/RlmD family)
MLHPASSAFGGILQRHLRDGGAAPRLGTTECRASDGVLCSACHGSAADYPSEVSLKNKALRDFWKAHQLGPVPPSPLVVSPRGRRYRAVSKRKIIQVGGSSSFALLAPDEEGSVTPRQVFDCLIEPPEHGAIYRLLHKLLTSPPAQPLLHALTYIIIKGSYAEHTVIFNGHSLNGPTMKIANGVSRALTDALPSVKGVFCYTGTPDDRYYLGSRSGGHASPLRKVYGSDRIFERVLGKTFLYHPLSFSQVNPSMLAELVETVRRLCDFRGNEHLFDLYSGYGLFAVSYADAVAHAVGVEWSRSAVDDAGKNGERNGAGNVRFVAANITAETVRRVLSRARPSDIVILDPPRNGPGAGVVETIAARGCRKVVHLVCNIDLLPIGLAQWRQAGYRLESAIPIDMFPGTDSIEVVTALSPTGT